jgi:hypothetical protein
VSTNGSTSSSRLSEKGCRSAEIDEIAGIVELAAYGVIDASDGGGVIIGSVLLIGGLVVVVPRHGLSGSQRVTLAAEADRIWRHGRTGAGWSYDDSVGGWVVGVRVCDPSDSSAMTCAAIPARCSADSGTCVTPVSVPSGA